MDAIESAEAVLGGNLLSSHGGGARGLFFLSALANYPGESPQDLYTEFGGFVLWIKAIDVCYPWGGDDKSARRMYQPNIPESFCYSCTVVLAKDPLARKADHR